MANNSKKEDFRITKVENKTKDNEILSNEKQLRDYQENMDIAFIFISKHIFFFFFLIFFLSAFKLKDLWLSIGVFIIFLIIYFGIAIPIYYSKINEFKKELESNKS